MVGPRMTLSLERYKGMRECLGSSRCEDRTVSLMLQASVRLTERDKASESRRDRAVH